MGTTFKKNPKPVKQKTLKRVQSICVYAAFGCTTGFGNVTHELVSRWAKKLKKTHIVVFALDNFEPAVYNFAKNVVVIPATPSHPEDKDPYCRHSFLEFIGAMNFDAVFILNDIEVTKSLVPGLSIVKEKKLAANIYFPKMITYFPIDSEPLASDLKCLSFFEEIITYTDYGREVIERLAPDQAARLQVVPHGVDHDVFFPLKGEKIAAQKEFLFGDKFVFGTVNRNSARKDPATILLAFSEFRKNHEPTNAVLYMHMNPTDPYGVDLLLICEKLKFEIGKDVFFPEDFSENKGFPLSDLNILYNCFDTFITTSTAEGWGLTVTEAMAAGVPMICPQHTSLIELTAAGATPLYELDPVVFVNDGNKVRFKCSVDEVATAMALHYHAIKESSLPKDAYFCTDEGLRKVSQLNWSDTSEEIWTEIVKYLPDPL